VSLTFSRELARDFSPTVSDFPISNCLPPIVDRLKIGNGRGNPAPTKIASHPEVALAISSSGNFGVLSMYSSPFASWYVSVNCV